MPGRSRQEGAAAVEFALLLPLLVVLAFGIIEFSTAYNRSQGMQAAVREGARVASTGDISVADVQNRVWSALQGNQGGSGFPDPGGSGSVSSDVEVQVFALSVPDEAGTPVAGTACDSSNPDFAVRVVAEVRVAHRDAYGMTLPLIPGSPYDLSHRAEAIFRCI